MLKKSNIYICVFLFLAILSMASCRKSDSPTVERPEITVPEELNQPQYRIGLPQGAAAMTVGEQKFDKAQILYYNSPAEGYSAVEHKKIDAFLFDRHSMTYAVKNNPSLKLLPQDIGEEHIVVGFPKGHHELCSKVNEFIRQYRKDGTYQEMYERWFGTGSPPQMPEIPAPENPTEKYYVGTEGLNEPMSFFGKGGTLTGFDLEFIKRLALFLNAEFDVESMTFPALISATESEKIDLLVSNLNATSERKEKMLMSDDYVDSAIAVMVHADTQATVMSDAIQSLRDLEGKKTGSLTGSCVQELTDPLQSGIEYLLFNDNGTSIQALRSGKVDAVLLDEPMARMWAARYPNELRFACIYVEDHYGYAFQKGSPLTQKVNEVIRMLKQSGELEALIKKWCNTSDPNQQLEVWTHRKDYTGSEGTLRFGSDPTQEPMCYFIDGRYVGLDTEIVNRVAYELNRKFEFVPMNFGSLIEAVNANKLDIVGGSMSITEARRQKVDFSDCYYDGGLSILTRGSKKSAANEITGIAQLDGKRIGVMTGTSSDRAARDHFPRSQIVYFNTFNDLVIALENGKIDAFLMEEPQARLLLKSRPNFTALNEQLTFDDYAFIFSKNEKELCDAFSEQIRAMKADGTLKKLEDKWFSGDETVQKMPEPLAHASKGTLRFATVPQFEPFTFLRNDRVIGYDIEVACLAAEKLGYVLEPTIMEWGGYIEAVASGKVQLGVSFTTVTEERKQQMLFSEPNYRGGLVVIVKRAGASQTTAGFGSWLKRAGGELAASFDRTFVREERWKLILHGLKITLLISVFSAILGTLLAFPVCMMRRSQHRFWRTLGHSYIALMQGTPILVILMILYYVIFAKVDINAVLVAIFGFSLNFAAYVSEMLRTGIEGIPKGQSEAAYALGFSRFAVFRHVILPQAVRSILPVYRGEFINVLKTTSIVGYIAIQDLTKMSDIIRSRTYEAFFPLIATAVIYFAVAWLLASGLSFVEYKLDPKNRRKHQKGETP